MGLRASADYSPFLIAQGVPVTRPSSSEATTWRDPHRSPNSPPTSPPRAHPAHFRGVLLRSPFRAPSTKLMSWGCRPWFRDVGGAVWRGSENRIDRELSRPLRCEAAFKRPVNDLRTFEEWQNSATSPGRFLSHFTCAQLAESKTLRCGGGRILRLILSTACGRIFGPFHRRQRASHGPPFAANRNFPIDSRPRRDRCLQRTHEQERCVRDAGGRRWQGCWSCSWGVRHRRWSRAPTQAAHTPKVRTAALR